MQLIKTFKDIDIHLTAEGRFTATVNGDIITKPTLAAIEKAITGAPKPLKPVKIMKQRYGCELETYEIVNTRNRSGRMNLVTSKGGEISICNATSYLVYSEEKADAARKITEEYDALKAENTKAEKAIEARFREVLSGAVPFTVDMLKAE